MERLMGQPTRRLPVLILVTLLALVGCNRGAREERVEPLPQKEAAPVAADVETGVAETGVEGTAVGEQGASAGFVALLGSPPELGYNARQGKALFEYYCATCHGTEGRGDGFNSYNLDPKPRDLTDRELQTQRSDDDLATVIRSGGGAAGFSTAMPPWGRTLTELQIRNLVVYVRLLPDLAEAEEG
jgi:mono/diheme cytochrome c family protein